MVVWKRVPHYECEDCWYSCPKSTGGCCNEAQGTECNCMADDVNRYIESLEVAARAVLDAAEAVSATEGESEPEMTAYADRMADLRKALEP